MAEPARFPMTADIAGVLEAARQQRAEAVGSLFAWLLRLFRRPAPEPALDSATPIR